MSQNTFTSTFFSKKLLIVAAMVSVGSTTGVASAHEWTVKIEGKEQHVEAKVVNFDGQQVLLEASNGVKQSFPVDELNDSDTHYLSDIVVAKEAVAQNKTLKKELQVELNELRLGYNDVWAVQLIAPNGGTVVRNYLALNNRQAAILAHRDFPNARVGAMRKLRGRSRYY